MYCRLDPAIQAFGVVGVFGKVREVLEHDRFHDAVEAFHDDVVRSGTTPDGASEEKRVGKGGLVASVEKGDSLCHVGEREPLADRHVDSVLRAQFRDFSDEGESVLRKFHLLDFLFPGELFFVGNGELFGNMEVLELALVLQERAERFGAQAVGHRNGERNLVGDFGATHGVFGTDVAAQDDGGVVAVSQGVADVFLGGIVNRVEVLEND